jgi:DNA gyrase/topoisomerase IV subunit B
LFSEALSAPARRLGVSVVNALSERLEVEVALGGQLYRQVFARGIPKSGLEKLTRVRFKPAPQIFGDKAKFNPQRLFKMARAKAYLFGGVEIRWRCDKALLHGTVRTARSLVHIGVELAAGMERAHHDFEGGLLGEFRMRVDRNAAAIVGDGEGSVGGNLHLDEGGMPGQSLVHGSANR